MAVAFRSVHKVIVIFFLCTLTLFLSQTTFADDEVTNPGFFEEVNGGPRWLQVDKDELILTNMGGENPIKPGPIGSQGAILFSFPHRFKWDPSAAVFSSDGNYIVKVAYQGRIYDCFIEVVLLADFFGTRLDVTLKQPSVVFFDKATKRCFLREWKTKVYAFEKVDNLVPVAWRKTLKGTPDVYLIELGEDGRIELEIERASGEGSLEMRLFDSPPPFSMSPIGKVTVLDAVKTIELENLGPRIYYVEVSGKARISYQIKVGGSGISKVEPAVR